jgi:hypothetical protein
MATLIGCAAFVVASGPVLSTASGASTLPGDAQVLPASQVVELASPGGPLTAPVDGRLRGPDFNANVTGVAWPTAAGVAPSRYVAASGHRLVVFALTLTQPASAVGVLGNGTATVSASLGTGSGSVDTIDLSAVNSQVRNSAVNSTTGTGSGTFVASVPAGAHGVVLTLTEGSFSQSLSLWTLKRVPPTPVVLYRSPVSSTVSVASLTGGSIPLTNPADGFTSQSQVIVKRAVLTAFSPDGSNSVVTSPNQAYFAITVASRYPQVASSDPNWGHYIANIQPLAGSALTFAPAGMAPVTATADNVVAPPDQDTSAGDDGLLDATYVFDVPASTTSGTLTIAPTATTGAEYSGFVGGSAVPIQVGGPTSFALTFQSPLTAAVVQPKPSWIGAPLPPTGSAAAAVGTGSPGSSSSGGLPVWLALAILVAVVAVILGVRRRRHKMLPVPAVEPSDVADHPTPAAHPAPDRTPTPAKPTDAAPTDAAPTDSSSDPSPVASPRPTTAIKQVVLPMVAALGTEDDLVVRVIGPVEITGWKTAPERGISTHLCCYLAMHPDRALTSDRLLLALWPTESERQEITKKTLHNYLSTLRRVVGSDHFPDAVTTGGYRFTGVLTDWQRFQELNAEADTAPPGEADRLRAEALSLVRSQPFEDAPDPTYRWIHTEGLASTITVAIVDAAHELAVDRLAAGDLAGSEWAAGQGLKASPTEESLWLDRVHAVRAIGDPLVEKRMWQEAVATLGPDGADRLR